MKVVVNRCFGGFSLSEAAYGELGIPWDGGSFGMGFAFKNDRTNPKLIEVVEKLGDAASGNCARLRVVEIPDGIDWEIDDYDGSETVREKHRSW